MSRYGIADPTFNFFLVSLFDVFDVVVVTAVLLLSVTTSVSDFSERLRVRTFRR